MGSAITDYATQRGEFINGKTSASLNLTYGGQHGYWARLGYKDKTGKTYAEWISNHAYVKRPMIPILLDYPKGFNLFKGEADLWKSNYKALLELHPLSIEGLNTKLNVDFDEHAVGKAGEMQEEVVNVTRNRSTLTFTFKEKAGKSISKFIDKYIRYLIMDPDTKRALIGNQINDITDIGGIYTPDFYAGTMLFIEPDPLGKSVIDAWLCCNMIPKETPDRIGQRNENGAGSLLDVSLEFTCITMNTEAVLIFAEHILNKLGILKMIPDLDMTLPDDRVHPDLEATNTGFDRVK